MDTADGGKRPALRFKRVVLKLSGEGFAPPGKSGIHIDETLVLARQLARVAKAGVQLAIVIGGGNILRGAQFSSGSLVIKPATAHYMGMLATVMNGLALQEALESPALLAHRKMRRILRLCRPVVQVSPACTRIKPGKRAFRCTAQSMCETTHFRDVMVGG